MSSLVEGCRADAKRCWQAPIAQRLNEAANEIERLERALDVARKQIVEITCAGTIKLRELGCDVDPPERTYLPALDRVDEALRGSRNE